MGHIRKVRGFVRAWRDPEHKQLSRNLKEARKGWKQATALRNREGSRALRTGRTTSVNPHSKRVQRMQETVDVIAKKRSERRKWLE